VLPPGLASAADSESVAGCSADQTPESETCMLTRWYLRVCCGLGLRVATHCFQGRHADSDRVTSLTAARVAGPIRVRLLPVIRSASSPFVRAVHGDACNLKCDPVVYD
jgi:hypothetical protein